MQVSVCHLMLQFLRGKALVAAILTATPSCLPVRRLAGMLGPAAHAVAVGGERPVA